MALSNRLRKVPSLFSKPDKSVQFAQENTILVIDNENKLLANGSLFQKKSYLDDSMQVNESAVIAKPILKNGPTSKTELLKKPTDV